jgi:hypothetical protein
MDNCFNDCCYHYYYYYVGRHGVLADASPGRDASGHAHAGGNGFPRISMVFGHINGIIVSVIIVVILVIIM